MGKTRKHQQRGGSKPTTEQRGGSKPTTEQRGGSKPTTGQRGGGLSVLTAQIESIQKKQNDLSASVASVDDRALTEALEEVLKIRGKSKQIEADVRFYTESFLKDEKTMKNLFERQESVPSEYVSLIGVLGNYSKMRNDMDTLIKSIYRYINLRLGYPLGSGEEPDLYTQPRSYSNESEDAGSSLPPIVGQPGYTNTGVPGGITGSKSRIPELVKKQASPNNEEGNAQGPAEGQGGSYWNSPLRRSQLRTRRLLRKKN